MTDEQWVWLLANEAIDRDEKLDSLCKDCRDEVTSVNRCTKCGKILSSSDGRTDSFTNPNFDDSRFERLMNESDAVRKVDEDTDGREN